MDELTSTSPEILRKSTTHREQAIRSAESIITSIRGTRRIVAQVQRVAA